MGVLGTGLYAGDFAMDLRSAVSAVLRLPFEGDRLVEILCETESGSADDPRDSDHTVFWLVVADQFARRGVVSERARDKALEIIESGADLAMQAKLGLDPAGLKQRKKVLEDVRGRVLAPVVKSTPRNVLKKPQAWLLDVGDVIVYPTFHGHCINPCFSSKAEITHWIGDGPVPWQQNGWAALVIVDRGRAFDFLAWYQPVVVAMEIKKKPTLSDLRGEVLWRLPRPGTLTALHSKRMEMEKIGMLQVDAGKVRTVFHDLRPGAIYAISDITIANQMSLGPQVPAELMPLPGTVPSRRYGNPFETIVGIDQICDTSL